MMKSKYILVGLGVLLAIALFFAPQAKADTPGIVHVQCVLIGEEETGLEMFLDQNFKTGFYSVVGKEKSFPLVWNIVDGILWVMMVETQTPIVIGIDTDTGIGQTQFAISGNALVTMCNEKEGGNA